MGDRKVLVTGGNRGIGYELAAALLARGDRVVLTTRDADRGDRAIRRLLADHPTGEVTVRTCDLSDPASVRRCADALLADGRPLDGVINNAGVLLAPPSRELTPDGVEVTLATNALGPLLLVGALAPMLRPAARVVSLTSRLHLPGSRGEPVDFDFDDPNLDHGYTPERSYKNSKLALMWVSTLLDRRLGPVTSNTVCPGFVPRTAARHTRGWLRFKLRWIVPRLPFAVTAEQAAADVLWVLDAPELADRGDCFIADRTISEASPQARDSALADRFATLAGELWPQLGGEE
ncbi:SDR family NAD(P)-dependent oxidoreductase [Microlunatus sp. Y2014]|uniref:SDR family NAD(P)-dependent oxidoreductase n=1 Tax=Microlunatus sp. Y2014 TaxID=3418488 RepID=UPI003DA71F71